MTEHIRKEKNINNTAFLLIISMTIINNEIPGMTEWKKCTALIMATEERDIVTKA